MYAEIPKPKRNLHREPIEPITRWERPNASLAHPEIEVLRVLSFVREDGGEFIVDRYLERARRASLKAGGSGIMHRVMAFAKPADEQSVDSVSTQFKLYQDENEWYIEHDLPDDDPRDLEVEGFDDPDADEVYFPDDDPWVEESSGEGDPDFEDPAPDPDFEEEQPDIDPDDVFVVVEEDDGSDDAVQAFYLRGNPRRW